MKQRTLNVAVLFLLIAFGASCYGAAASAPQQQENRTEWTWNVAPQHPDPQLPNVALVGDSISRNYFPEVQRRLAGKANVYLMANSISIGDPDLPGAISMFSQMAGVRFRVVHFNNGLHGGEISEAEYEAAFPAYLAALRAIAPDATFIWTSTTAAKSDSEPGLTNARIAARNAIAQSSVTPGMLEDDQYSLMRKHQDLYVDNVHYNEVGSNIGGTQAAEIILQAMQSSAKR